MVTRNRATGWQHAKLSGHTNEARVKELLDTNIEYGKDFIEDICKAAPKAANSEIYYGTSNGGTTIQLPFDFVQWHQKQLQFHHSYEKIYNLIYTL